MAIRQRCFSIRSCIRSLIFLSFICNELTQGPMSDVKLFADGTSLFWIASCEEARFSEADSVLKVTLMQI